ncbi:MAG TPA: EamA family transporter [Bryobacteraceae bacterium]|nr:EamA family transporter [Bryobacteraceae bacterium]
MNRHPHWKAWLALFATYFFWGTTYLGIRMALESFPPLMLISGRFLASGILMVLGALLLRAKLPRGRELRMTALYGALAIGGGNGALVVSEQWIPSGVAALMVAISPFWMVGLEALLPGGERLHLPTLGGIAIGFAGVMLLFAPGAASASVTTGPGLVGGFILLQAGALCWCLGSLLQRRLKTEAHPVVSGAVQQLAAGLTYLPFALLIPEHPVHLSTRGVLAAAWLVIFGSVVGYSAFIYAMEHLPVPIVSTYTYVNPVVALALGWLFYREPFGSREFLAMTGVFVGVAAVKYFSMNYKTRSEPEKAASSSSRG